jgi:hypothetical protein
MSESNECEACGYSGPRMWHDSTGKTGLCVVCASIDDRWPENLSMVGNLILDAIEATQWRPIRTAPRDGRVIEARYYESVDSVLVAWTGDTLQWCSAQHDAKGHLIHWREHDYWRTAHRDWNEGESDG